MTTQIKATIQGITPLKMSAISQEVIDGLLSGRAKPKQFGDKGTPREVAEKSLYKEADGTLYNPIKAIFAAIREAGKFHKLGKKQVSTEKNSLVPAYVSASPEHCSLNTKDWEVDIETGFNKNVEALIVICRPRLDKWEVKFNLEFDSDYFPSRLVRQLVDDAGIKCGLLAQRPGRRGMYGKFKVIKWDEKKL